MEIEKHANNDDNYAFMSFADDSTYYLSLIDIYKIIVTHCSALYSSLQDAFPSIKSQFESHQVISHFKLKVRSISLNQVPLSL